MKSGDALSLAHRRTKSLIAILLTVGLLIASVTMFLWMRDSYHGSDTPESSRSEFPPTSTRHLVAPGEALLEDLGSGDAERVRQAVGVGASFPVSEELVAWLTAADLRADFLSARPASIAARPAWAAVADEGLWEVPATTNTAAGSRRWVLVVSWDGSRLSLLGTAERMP